MMEATLWILVVFILCSALRIMLGPTAWDRLLGFSQMSALLIPLLVLLSISKSQDFLLDIAITYALLGFIGTLFMARFIRRRGRREPG